MSNVLIEAESINDIVWPSACAICAQDGVLQNSIIPEFEVNSSAEVSLNVCCLCAEHISDKRSSLKMAFVSFGIFLCAILLLVNIDKTIHHLVIRISSVFIFLFSGIAAFASWLTWPVIDYSKAHKCIVTRNSKTVWQFTFCNNSYFAYKFKEANDLYKRLQAGRKSRAQGFQNPQAETRYQKEQQQRAEDEKRRRKQRHDKKRQQEAEYKQEQQRAEDEQKRRFEQEQHKADSDSAKQTAKGERYYGKVLDLHGPTTKEDVTRQYRKLCLEYHPDRVNHLGPKLKELAEKEMKDINEAHAYFEKKYGL